MNKILLATAAVLLSASAAPLQAPPTSRVAIGQGQLVGTVSNDVASFERPDRLD